MSSAYRYLPHYSVRDYLLWDGDWELWQGIPVAMTPSPYGPHARVLVSAASALKQAVDTRGCAATVLAEIDWIISDDMVVRPDVLIVCGSEPPRHVEQPPALVVEILSEGTRQRDQDEKRLLYQDCGVPYYLLLDPEHGQLTALQLGPDGRYVQLAEREVVRLQICGTCSLEVPIAPMFR